MTDNFVSARVKGYFCGGRDNNGEVVTIEECEKDNKELEIKFLRKRIEQLEAQIHKNKEDEIKFLKQLKEIHQGFLGRERNSDKYVPDMPKGYSQ